MKKILFIFTANQYNVVNEMVWRIADYLEQQGGFTVGRYRLDDYEKVKDLDWDIVFSAQAIEFSKIKEADGRIHVTWLVDHPRYLVERFMNYPELEKVYVGCVDRTHVTYLDKYYQLPHAFFAPHFGWEAKKIVPYEERSCELFFPASYVCWEKSVASRYPGLGGPLKVITEKTITFLEEHPDYTLEGGMETVFQQFGEKDYLELSKSCLEIAGEYIDLKIRSDVREYILHALLQAGIRLTVCGKNWSQFPVTEAEKEYLTILGEEIPYLEVVEKMADSKMVLNIMPWFKDGSHERVAMSTRNGALCLTDKSRYLEEVWGNDGVIFFDVKHPETLVEKIKKYTQNEEEAKKIAAAGMEKSKIYAAVGNWGTYINDIIAGAKQEEKKYAAECLGIIV